MDEGNDGRRWLVRKATGGMGAAPFDTKQASIIGPDTEPIWLVSQAEYDALLKAARDVAASWRGGTSMGHAMEGLFEVLDGS